MNARRIGRLGLLAAGLGIGAAVASAPGIASADSLPPFDPNDFAFSMDGITLFHDGTAQAYSGLGDVAFANGPDSIAEAGAGPDVFGSPVGPGLFDMALADGNGSLAAGGKGFFDRALAVGANTISDDGGYNGVLGNDDFGAALGANAEADAGVFTTVPSSNDLALVFDPAAYPPRQHRQRRRRQLRPRLGLRRQQLRGSRRRGHSD